DLPQAEGLRPPRAARPGHPPGTPRRLLLVLRPQVLSGLIWRSKSTRKALFWLSPMGFPCRFGRSWSEMLGFIGLRRKSDGERGVPFGKGVFRRFFRSVQPSQSVPVIAFPLHVSPG